MDKDTSTTTGSKDVDEGAGPWIPLAKAHLIPITSGVYQIRHAPSGKVYVGSSRDINLRIHTHIRELEGGTHYNKGLPWA
jgi:hypothetical protein